MSSTARWLLKESARRLVSIEMANCKPGDLAVIIKSTTDIGRVDVGKVVEVRYQATGYPDEILVWSCLPTTTLQVWEGASYRTSLPGEAVAVTDRILRPIRDPGPEAVDETLLNLKAPKCESHDETKSPSQESKVSESSDVASSG